MDAYITKANAKRLVNNLDISTIDVNKEIFKIEFKWFNDYEVRNLLLIPNSPKFLLIPPRSSEHYTAPRSIF